MNDSIFRRRHRSPAFGLLTMLFLITLPGLVPGVGLAAPAPVDDGSREVRKLLIRAINQRDVPAARESLGALIRLGGKTNLATLVKLLPRIPAEDDVMYWTLVEGSCSFTDQEAMNYLGDTIIRYQRHALARDLLYGLSKNRSPHTLHALLPILEKGHRDLQIMAVQKLARLYLPETVDALIQALVRVENEVKEVQDDDLAREIAFALHDITGKNFGPFSPNWVGWWKSNRDHELGPRSDDDDEGHGGGTVVESLTRQRKEEFYELRRASKKGVIVLSARYTKKTQRDLNNDNIEHVLSQMGVPHTVVPREDFDAFDLSDTGAIVINCAQFHEFCICPHCKPGGDKKNRLYRCTGCNKHIKFSASLSRQGIAKIVKFVKGGGYVFAEDWVVKEIVEKAFPRYVKAGKVLRKNVVPDVDVVPGRGMATHPYLKGIFEASGIDFEEIEREVEDEEEGRTSVKKRKGKEREGVADAELLQIKHRWTIDDESWAFDLLDPKKVLILLSSGELQDRADGQGVVAFAFSPGGKVSEIGKTRRPRRSSVVVRGPDEDTRGRPEGRTGVSKGGEKRGRAGAAGGRAGGKPRPGVVLQVLSHFGKQESVQDEHLLQNLLLNFLIDANVERLLRNGPDDPPEEDDDEFEDVDDLGF